MKSYDVYISRGTEPIEGEIWSNAIAHFEEMERAQEFVEKLMNAGERAKLEASDLPELPTEEKKRGSLITPKWVRKNKRLLAFA